MNYSCDCFWCGFFGRNSKKEGECGRYRVVSLSYESRRKRNINSDLWPREKEEWGYCDEYKEILESLLKKVFLGKKRVLCSAQKFFGSDSFFFFFFSLCASRCHGTEGKSVYCVFMLVKWGRCTDVVWYTALGSSECETVNNSQHG